MATIREFRYDIGEERWVVLLRRGMCSACGELHGKSVPTVIGGVIQAVVWDSVFGECYRVLVDAQDGGMEFHDRVPPGELYATEAEARASFGG